MEFQRLLLEAAKALRQEEVRALVFLCTDLLGHSGAVESAGELFSRLCDQDHLSEERPHLLSELLCVIQRTRLLRDLALSSGPSNLVSAYRKLLYQLSEDLTEDDLKDIKFLLNNKLPRKKLEDSITTLEVFIEMEHMDLISETNLDFLESILQTVCPVLVEKIRRFKAQNSVSGSLIAQEIGQLRFEPLPLPPTQVPFDQRVPAEEAELTDPLQELELSSFNSSPVPRSVFNDRDEHEAGPPEPTGFLPEASAWGSDALVSLPEENQTSSRTETSNANTGLEAYPMTTLPRGCCFIINNHDFRESGRGMREGTMVDEKSLRKVFGWLGFEVEVERDCTSKQMLSLMQNLADRSRQEWDCVVCFVLSHGLEGCVYGVDGDTVNIRMLMEPFIGTKCRSLAGKPKLFFIQACQGNSHQGVVYMDGDRPEHSDVDTDAVQMKFCIPTHADFLLGMATVPNFVSFRERANGTWYIQSLCQNLVAMVPRGIDLMSILTKVNADVSKKSDYTGSKKQMPQPAFTLTKTIVFPVPSGPVPALPTFTSL